MRSGIKGHQKELQAVPLSCIPKFIQILLDKEELKVNNLEDIKEIMPATHALKKEQEVASFYDIILNNEEGEPIRFFSFSIL